MSDAGPFALPNILTCFRVLAIPVIAVLAMSSSEVAVWLAFWLHVAAAVTDYLDGLAARMLNQYSDLGRMLDPVADKLLVAALLLVLVARDVISDWSLVPATLILAREFLVSGLREYLGPRNIVIHVSRLAKWKTTAQLIALGLLILVPVVPALAFVGLPLLWIAGALTAVTGYDYVRQGLVHLVPGALSNKQDS